jgi:hypothetical protein
MDAMAAEAACGCSQLSAFAMASSAPQHMLEAAHSYTWMEGVKSTVRRSLQCYGVVLAASVADIVGTVIAEVDVLHLEGDYFPHSVLMFCVYRARNTYYF